MESKRRLRLVVDRIRKKAGKRVVGLKRKVVNGINSNQEGWKSGNLTIK